MLNINKVITKLIRNSSRVYLDGFVKKAAESIPTNAWVLDAGAGNCIYKHHFINANYESADFCQVDKEYGEITYVCDLANIPVDDNKYDIVLLTQVLEHLPNPKAVLLELNRVLKPGQNLWLSAPLFYEEHEIPYDYYRYTQYGINYLLQETGFTIEKIEWLEGYYGTLSYQLRVAARSLPFHPKYFGGGLVGILSSVSSILFKIFFSLLAIFFSRLDIRFKYDILGHCKNYAVIAKKSES